MARLAALRAAAAARAGYGLIPTNSAVQHELGMDKPQLESISYKPAEDVLLCQKYIEAYINFDPDEEPVALQKSAELFEKISNSPLSSGYESVASIDGKPHLRTSQAFLGYILIHHNIKGLLEASAPVSGKSYVTDENNKPETVRNSVIPKLIL